MRKESLFEAIGLANEKFILEARQPIPKTKTQIIVWRPISTAGLFVALICIGLYTFVLNQNKIPLSDDSRGVTVRYYNGQTTLPEVASFVPLTEEEIFYAYDTIIVHGMVESTRNIAVDFNGSLNYRAIATIKVDNRYSGECENTVEVLVPIPLSDSVAYINDMTLVYLKPGMEGIFLLYPYGEHDIWAENGASLVEADIAKYGFLDASRFAFLNTSDGLIFSRSAYKSIENISSMSEVEEYINRMLEGRR